MAEWFSSNLTNLGTIVIFLFISMMLITGHGGVLLAGFIPVGKYADQKPKYDLVKVGRVSGSGMLVITGILAVGMLFDSWLPAWSGKVLAALFFLTIIVCGILLGGCKLKD